MIAFPDCLQYNETEHIKPQTQGGIIMALAVDIGNTNIVLGCFHGEKIDFIARLATERGRTAEQYAAEIKSIIQL